MLTVTWQSRNYAPEKVIIRYVRADGPLFRFCEVGEDRRYDLRQGVIDAADLPFEIRDAAAKLRGVFGYVAWSK